MKNILLRACGRALLCLASVCAMAVGSSQAMATPAEAARGLVWLEGQVQAGGGFAQESRRAGLVQLQCETAITLRQVGGNPALAAALSGAVADAGADAPTETLGCGAYLRRQVGQPVPQQPLLDRYLAQQGFAAYEGLAVPSATDLGWALAAQLGAASAAEKAQLLGWVQAIQQADGSFDAGGASNVWATAQVLRALNNHFAGNPVVAGMAARALQYLLSQRDAQGLWSNDTAVTAAVFEAVHPYSDAQTRATVQAHLLSSQQADGSWASDPYVSALALRALFLSGQPPSAGNQGGVRMRVVQALTGQAVPAAQVELLAGDGSRLALGQSGADGAVQFMEIPAQAAVVRVTKPGFSALVANAAIQAGLVRDLGDVGLFVSDAATGARVTGLIRDAGSGAPVAGVQIALEPGGRRALTGANGRFELTAVPEGPVTLAATKAGYNGAAGSGQTVNGQTLEFSPVLAQVSQTVTEPAFVRGRVLADATAAPLADAQVVLYVREGGSYFTQTGADGSFSFPGVVRDIAVVQAERPGYKPGAQLLYLAQDANPDVQLRLKAGPDPTPRADLRILEVDKRQMLSDPVTLQASGVVRVTVLNLGRLDADAGTELLAFEDRNANRRLDEGTDLVLGAVQLPAALAPSERVVLDIPVSGEQLFRDNAVYVWADSAQAVDESDELNNVERCNCTSGLPFIEDFNDGSANGAVEFANQAGSVASWVVRDGYYEASTGGGAAFGDARWVDYDAEVKAYFPEGPLNDAALAFRVMDEGNWYRFSISAGQARIISRINGVVTTHAQVAVAVLGQHWHKMRVEVRGKRVRAYLDDNEVMSFDDLALPRGKLALMQDNVRMRYDDLRVFEAPMFEEDFSAASHAFQPATFNPNGNAAANVVNGRLVRNSYGSSWAGDKEWSDYTAQVDIRFPNGKGNDAGFVVLADAAPGGRVVQVTLNGTLVRLIITGKGVVRAKTIAVSTDPEFVYRFRYEINGAVLRFFINDEFLFDYDELTWTQGAIGITQDGVVASYDNFKVWRSGAQRPDLTASRVTSGASPTAGQTRLTVRVGNGGSAAVARGVPLRLTLTEPGGALRSLPAVSTSRALSPGAYEDVALDADTSLLATGGTLTVMVDQNAEGLGTVLECNEANNAVSTDVLQLPRTALALSVAVAASQPAYTSAEQAVFTARVANPLGVPGDAMVRFSVLDAAGRTVDVLPMGPAVSISPASSATVQAPWPVGSTLAGGYAVKAELVNDLGGVYSSASADFTVIAAAPTVINSARATADRYVYHPAQTIQLTARVANLTPNVLQEFVAVELVVRTAAGQTVLTRTGFAGQLAPGAQRTQVFSLPGGSLPQGAYGVEVRLHDGQSALATGTTTFTVQGSGQTGQGLQGQLTATPATAQTGQAVTVVLAATYNGNVALANVPVTLRLLEPVGGTVLASYTQVVTNWPVNSAQTMSWPWSATGISAGVVVAATSAQVNGMDIPLGQANIHVVGTPALTADPAQLAYPPLYPGQAAQRSVQLLSVGSAPVTSITYTLQGSNPGQFVINGGGCAQSASLAAGASCTLSVSYRPTQTGAHSATLRIAYAGGTPLQIALSGQAQAIVLGGALQAAPAEVPAGNNIDLTYSISNPASINTTGQFRLRLLDAQAQELARWEFGATLPANGSYAGNQRVPAPDTPQTLKAVLRQLHGATSTVLATTSVQVTPALPQYQVQLASQIQRDTRILMLASCPAGGGRETDDDDDDHRRERGEQCRPEPDRPECLPERVQALGTYLRGMGIEHKIVTSEAAFKHEMRCGGYNSYWLTGGSAKLDHWLVKEVREAVWRGDSLILDGEHDDRNQLLHPIAGVRYRGKLSGDNHAVTIPQDSLFAPGTLPTRGRGVKFDLAGGQSQAQFAGSHSGGHHHSNHHQHGGGASAIVSHRYGAGASLVFAFDLAAMLGADPAQADARLKAVVSTTAGHLGSAGTATLSVGDVVALNLSVGNQGTRAVTLELNASLPPGLSHHSASVAPEQVSAPEAAGQPGTVSWTLALAPQSQQQITWRVRVDQAGSHSLPLTLHSVPDGTNELPQLLAGHNETLNVEAGDALRQQALPAIQALQPPKAGGRSYKTQAIQHVGNAQALHAQGRYQDALVQWMSAANSLIGITGVDVSPARDAVALALEASTDALCQSLMCVAGELELSDSQPRLGSSLGLGRKVTNICSMPLRDVSLVTALTSRRTGQGVLETRDANLNLAAGQTVERDGRWSVNGRAGDEVDAVLSAHTQGHQIELDRQMVTLTPAQSACNAGQPLALNRFQAHGSGHGLFAQGGQPGNSQWEWALGASINHHGRYTAEHMQWKSGRTYTWQLAIDKQGRGSFTVRDGGQVVASERYNAASARLKPGDALALTVRSTADAGNARISATLTRIHNQALNLGVATSAAGQQQQAALYKPALAKNGLNAEGTLRLDYTGDAPPAGSRLQFSLQPGNAQCQ